MLTQSTSSYSRVARNRARIGLPPNEDRDVFDPVTSMRAALRLLIQHECEEGSSELVRAAQMELAESLAMVTPANKPEPLLIG